LKTRSWLACASASILPMMLSGCFLLSTTRRLPVPRSPSTVQTVTPEELVNRLDDRWNALQSLTAKVEIQASVLHSQQGVAKDYTTIPANILLEKPAMLRVYGRVPVLGTELFDMVSDGKDFTLYVPSKNKAIRGSNAVKTKSANQLENLRPDFFLDALDVRGLKPDEFYTVIEDTATVEDPTKKHLYEVPEYILSIMRPKPDSRELGLVRVIHFHREDLLPYQQDVYDHAGKLETQVFYGSYADYSGNKYPSVVTIKRPLDEIQLVLTVDNVTENMKLPADEFSIRIPSGTPIQILDTETPGTAH